MPWSVPLPAETGDEVADLAAFAAWELQRERDFYPGRFGPDGARLPAPPEFDYYLGVPEPTWLNRNDRDADGVYLCSGIPKFVSAARLARYRSDPERWPVESACSYAIDSGAYIALNGANTDVPWFAPPDVYGGMILRFITNNGYPPDFCAPQDVPCEPSVRARTGLSVEQHQDLTTDSYEFLVREFPMVPWIPVLQGWEPRHYRLHRRKYEDRGIDLAACHRVGIGSICRRGHLPEIVEVIEQFADAGYKMHGFGIKTTALPIIGHLLRSADSMAWSFHARKNNIRLPGCTHAGDCRNCYRYAAHWRQQVLASLPSPEEARTMNATKARQGDLFADFAAVVSAGLGLTADPTADDEAPLGRTSIRANDGLDEVRCVLARSTLHGTVLGLPSETLPRTLWQLVHATLVQMGAKGGSRMGQPYTFDTDRSADLRAFIAGGPAPLHERTAAGWVRTPDALAAKVVAQFVHLPKRPGPVRVLEPSGGDGSLIRAVLAVAPEAEVTAVEPVNERARQLGKISNVYPLHVSTFEQYANGDGRRAEFDLIVMNPPYSVPGNRKIWADHVRLAWGMLAKGGRLVAILPGRLQEHTDTKTTELLRLLGRGVEIEELPARSFRESGTDFDTCVLAVTKPACKASTFPFDRSVYRPAAGDPVPVRELRLTARGAVDEPVQAFFGFGGEKVVRYVGDCIVCKTSTWSDGDNDPRGAMGQSTVYPLCAEEHDMQGPTYCVCSACCHSGIMMARAETRARSGWTELAPEQDAMPMLFEWDSLAAAVDAAMTNP